MKFPLFAGENEMLHPGSSRSAQTSFISASDSSARVRLSAIFYFTGIRFAAFSITFWICFVRDGASLKRSAPVFAETVSP